ncbi:MAG: transcription termination factor NusA [Chloroflexota bacterium]
MKSEFLLAFNELCNSRSLSKDVVLETIESALVSAFRRNVGVSSAQHVTAKVDSLTGDARVFAEKEVVEKVQDPRTEVSMRAAKKVAGNEVAIGETIMVDSTPHDFGRIAAQTAKQVILQRIREAERDQLFEDFSGRQGEMVIGTVQSVAPQGVTLGLGRTEAFLPRNQMVPGERFRPHGKVQAYVLEVRRTSRGPQIIVSRSHRHMLRRMLEVEVPEIYNGLVEIKNVAREAGQRSKVAVSALQDGVDPVGACVGMRGVRIQSIVRELNDEKIDVIEWNPDPRVFITKSLSPARVSQVYLDPDSNSGKTALVIVADDQLSLAIGREGQNARLAAKLTGWRIDIQSLTEAAAESLTKLDHPLVVDRVRDHDTLIKQVELILAKKAADRPVTAEDFSTLNRLVDLVEGAFAARAEKQLQEEEEARRAVPSLYWQMPLSLLELDDSIVENLESRGFTAIGHIVALYSLNPLKLRRRAGLGDEEFEALQERMSNMEFPTNESELAQMLGEELELVEEELPEVIEEVVEAKAPESEQDVVPVDLYEEPPEELLIPSEEPEEVAPEPVVETAPEPEEKPAKVVTPARREEGEERLLRPKPAKKRKKGRKQRRRDQLVDDFDEIDWQSIDDDNFEELED